MTAKIFLIGVVSLTTIAVTAGLVLTGGPFEVRRNKFDIRRLQDLGKIAEILVCKNSGTRRAVLPVELTVESLSSDCSLAIKNDMLLDKETGQPYDYGRLNDTEFSICGKFYDAKQAIQRTTRQHSFRLDVATGCIAGKLR